MHDEIAKIQLRLPLDVRDFLAQEAKRENRSMNGQIIQILQERQREEEKQFHKETEQKKSPE